MHGLQEVAANPGVRRGGPVERGEVQFPEAGGHGVQGGVLQGGGGLLGAGQPFGPAAAQPRGEPGEGADHQGGGDGDRPVGVVRAGE
ncbi:hypothetical protein ABZ641_34745, partial [Kitasatospora sp. NPDC007106]